MRLFLLALTVVPLVACQSTPDVPTGTPTGDGSAVIAGESSDAAAPADPTPAASTLGPGSAALVGDYECPTGQPFDYMQLGIADGRGRYEGSTRLGEDGGVRPVEEGAWFFEDGRMTFVDGSASVTYEQVGIEGETLELQSFGERHRCSRAPRTR